MESNIKGFDTPMMSRYRDEEEAVLKFCDKNRFDINIGDTYARVFAWVDTYLIVIGPDQRLYIYHKNYRDPYPDEHIPQGPIYIEGYHYQGKICEKLLSALEIIYDHETGYKEKRNLPGPLKARLYGNSRTSRKRKLALQKKKERYAMLQEVDRLFTMIEEEVS